jgi:hypothetical protein
MKRFVGLLLAGAGAGAVIWGGFHVMTGESSALLVITDKIAISALVCGLAGTALLSIGLVWVRD